MMSVSTFIGGRKFYHFHEYFAGKIIHVCLDWRVQTRRAWRGKLWEMGGEIRSGHYGALSTHKGCVVQALYCVPGSYIKVGESTVLVHVIKFGS